MELDARALGWLSVPVRDGATESNLLAEPVLRAPVRGEEAVRDPGVPLGG